MRGLKRNEGAVSYCSYLGDEDVRDEHGRLTGEKRATYADPAPVAGSVSKAGGWVHDQLFGLSIEYDHVILTHDKNLLIKEEDLIHYKGSVYVVRRIAETLNVTAIAVRRVSTSA